EFLAVLAALLAFRFDPVKAGLAAAIAMTTSPAVLMLIVHDSASDGQVTERAMNLTALNGLLSSILVTILLGSEHYEAQSGGDRDPAAALPLPRLARAGCRDVVDLARDRAPHREDARGAFRADRGNGGVRRGARDDVEAPGDPRAPLVRALRAERRSQLRPAQREPRAGRTPPLHRALRDHGREPAALLARRRRRDRARRRARTRRGQVHRGARGRADGRPSHPP